MTWLFYVSAQDAMKRPADLMTVTNARQTMQYDLAAECEARFNGGY